MPVKLDIANINLNEIRYINFLKVCEIIFLAREHFQISKQERILKISKSTFVIGLISTNFKFRLV